MNYKCPQCYRSTSEWELVKNGGLCDCCKAISSEKRQVKCKANGCHDRYNCQLYDMSSEPKGTTHIIPLDHKPGDEGCFMYVPKENLTKDEGERLLLKDFYSDKTEF